MRSPPSQSPPSPPDPPEARPTIDRRLARLYGESLFGAWLDPVEYMAAGHRERKRGHFGKRLAIVLLAALLVSAGVWLTRRGLARQAEQARAQVAKDVAAFLAEGELDRLAQFLALLSPPAKPLPPSDPYLDLILQAEAALYRYQDASPARLLRLQPHLTAGAARRLLVRLTVASRGERAAAHDTLAALLPDFAKNPEYRTLMATVQEQRGEVEGARQSWERSFQAGPLWLPHRYLQCAFEARQRNAQALARLLEHMARVAPDSPWTRLAFQHFSSPAAPPAGGAAAKPPSPVGEHHAQLGLALAGWAAGDLRAARQALGRALAAVNDQAPFVLDAFDRLLEAKADALASEMTALEAWPRGNRVAQAKLAALQSRSAQPERPPDATAPPPEPEVAAAQPKKPSPPAKAKPAKAGATKKQVAKAAAAKRKAAAKKSGGRRRR